MTDTPLVSRLLVFWVPTKLVDVIRTSCHPQRALVLMNHHRPVSNPQGPNCRCVLLCLPHVIFYSAGHVLQRKAEEEAASKYQAGLALLEELEANDNKRTAAVYR